MMKYFTLADWISDQDIESVDMDAIRETRKEYEDYLVSVASKLPPDLLRLHETIRLNDAHLRSFELNIEQKKITFTIDTYPIGENNTMSLHTIVLQYHRVSDFRSTSDPQKGLPGPSGYGDIGNAEIELVTPGVFQHRFVLSSGIQLSVNFGDFSFSGVKK